MTDRPAVRVSGDIDAYCTKCREDRTHTIHAIVNGVPAKVECNSCHGVHNYRAAKSQRGARPAREAAASVTSAAPAVKASKPRAEKAPAAPPPGQSWEERLSGKEAGARPYRFTESYAVGEVVRHTLFGLGIVELRLSPQKINVLFRDGAKILIDNKSAP